jgi:hypothetical protein
LNRFNSREATGGGCSGELQLTVATLLTILSPMEKVLGGLRHRQMGGTPAAKKFQKIADVRGESLRNRYQ